MNTIIDALKWRYATKQFDTEKKLTPAQREILLDAIRLAPSSMGLQPWKFVVISNPEIRMKLREAAYGQPQITDASHLIVFAIKNDLNDAKVDEYIDLVAHTRGVNTEMLKGYGDMIKEKINNTPPADIKEWAAHQAYIALGVLLTVAASLGVDVCPMEGFDPKQFDEILGLRARGLESRVVAAVGFRNTSDPAAQMAKVRFPKEKMIIEVK